jgi:hypothetical protein
MSHVAAISSLEDLRRHIRETLCSRDRLDPANTIFHEGAVIRSGKPCGLFFQVEGPRLLKNYALWVSDEHRILFYDSKGWRFAETRLRQSPDAQQLAA